MKVVLLAAGKSSRTYPISNKNFLCFAGVPLIIRMLRGIYATGKHEVTLVTNEECRSSLSTMLSEYGLSPNIVIQNKLEEGMGGAVRTGLKSFTEDEPVAIINSNDSIDMSVLSDMITKLDLYDGVVLAQKVNEYFPGGYLEVDDENIIKRVTEKPGEGNEPSDLVNIVFHLFKSSHQVASALGDIDCSYEQAFNALIGEGSSGVEPPSKNQKVYAYPYTGPWNTIKYPWHILEMSDQILSQQESFTHETAEIAPSANIKGDHVVIEKSVKIMDNAVIVGPCYIGEGSVIGNNCLIRQSHIGKNNNIGYQTEIARSFFAEGVSAHMAYIGDSVLDRGVNFGAFSATANWRLDGKPVKVDIKGEMIDSHHTKLGAFLGENAKVGIHASLMPGLKVAPNGFVMPGSLAKNERPKKS